MRSHHGVSGSKMQIFLVFQSPPLLSWLKMNSWTHGVMRRRSAPHPSSARMPSTQDLQSLPALFLDPKERIVHSPGHWVFSVWRQGCQDVGINDGRFLRICEWLMIDWLAFRRFLNVSWPQVWGMPGLLCSELWWRSIEPGTQEVWVLDLLLSELTVISVFLFLLS